MDVTYAFILESDSGHIEIVNFLLHNSNIDPCADDNSALFGATVCGHTEIVKLFLNDSRISTNSINCGDSLSAACEFGYVEIVEYMIQYLGIYPDEESIQQTLYNEHIEVIKVLIKYDRVDHTGILSWACRNGYVELVQLLINQHYNHIRYDLSLIEAVIYGHIDIVKIILTQTNVDPSVNNNEAIIAASRKGHEEIVELLLQDSRVDPSDNDNSAIINTIDNRHVYITQLLYSDVRVSSTYFSLYTPDIMRYF